MILYHFAITYSSEEKIFEIYFAIGHNSNVCNGIIILDHNYMQCEAMYVQIVKFGVFCQ